MSAVPPSLGGFRGWRLLGPACIEVVLGPPGPPTSRPCSQLPCRAGSALCPGRPPGSLGDVIHIEAGAQIHGGCGVWTSTVFPVCSQSRGRDPEFPPQHCGHTPSSAFSAPAGNRWADGFHTRNWGHFVSKGAWRRCAACSPCHGSPGTAALSVGDIRTGRRSPRGSQEPACVGQLPRTPSPGVHRVSGVPAGMTLPASATPKIKPLSTGREFPPGRGLGHS